MPDDARLPVRQSLLGQPEPRIDGRLKVTGQAPYAFDEPVANPAQYHRGSLTLASASTPVTSTTVKDTMPISGLGKPNADACGVTITEPHDSTGLMLQEGT